MASILVLHGPNMTLKGVDALDDALQARAEELELTLTTLQANGEAGLLDALHAEADGVDGVLVNPGVLAPAAWALAEALSLLRKPAVEVLLEAPAAQRGPSALTGVVLAQVHGKGADGYLEALGRLKTRLGSGEAAPAGDEAAPAPVRRVGRARLLGKGPLPPPPPPTRTLKTLGKKPVTVPAPAPPPAAKSLGRKVAGAPAPAFAGLTREQVKKKLAARLAGTLSPAELATWARGEWSALQKGGPCEPGWKDRLDGVLLTLMGATRASDDLLLAQLAKLE